MRKIDQHTHKQKKTKREREREREKMILTTTCQLDKRETERRGGALRRRRIET